MRVKLNRKHVNQSSEIDEIDLPPIGRDPEEAFRRGCLVGAAIMAWALAIKSTYPNLQVCDHCSERIRWSYSTVQKGRKVFCDDSCAQAFIDKAFE